MSESEPFGSHDLKYWVKRYEKKLFLKILL